MAAIIHRIAFEDNAQADAGRIERLKRIALEDDRKANNRRLERLKRVALEDLLKPDLGRLERLKAIALEDNPAINAARPERLKAVGFEDAPQANPARADKVKRVAIEDYILWPLNIKIQDVDGNLVADAEVRIYSTSSSYGYKTNSDASGLANILFKADDKHVMLIRKAGFKTYKHHFNREEPLGGIPLNWEETLWPIVPIILLQSGETVKSLNPHDPINPMYE